MDQILEHLKTLTGYSEADRQVLAAVAARTQAWADEMTRVFYDTLFAYEPTASVFEPGERERRQETLRSWYLRVTSGEIDDDFWRHQYLVGLIHIPRQVRNGFMLGMMSRVQQAFFDRCLSAFALDEARTVYGAFKRVTDVTGGLIAEGYFENYVEAMVRVGGLSKTLIRRMMSLEITKLIEEAGR